MISGAVICIITPLGIVIQLSVAISLQMLIQVQKLFIMQLDSDNNKPSGAITDRLRYA